MVIRIGLLRFHSLQRCVLYSVQHLQSQRVIVAKTIHHKRGCQRGDSHALKLARTGHVQRVRRGMIAVVREVPGQERGNTVCQEYAVVRTALIGANLQAEIGIVPRDDML